MNEHQLKAEAYSLVLHRLKAKRDADYIRDAIVRMAKAYADARVVSECKVLGETVNLLHQTIATKNAEIKRLREGVEFTRNWARHWANPIHGLSEELAYTYGVFVTAINDNILSPAPVTETQNEDQE